MRSKLLGRVQMMLEDESSPLEKEVKMEREIQEQLREQDEANILAGGSTILHDIARPRLGTEEAANGTVYTRSRLNPDWDYFRGEPSPSPSSSCAHLLDCIRIQARHQSYIGQVVRITY
jgi:hypothetical protein